MSRALGDRSLIKLPNVVEKSMYAISLVVRDIGICEVGWRISNI